MINRLEEPLAWVFVITVLFILVMLAIKSAQWVLA